MPLKQQIRFCTAPRRRAHRLRDHRQRAAAGQGRQLAVATSSSTCDSPVWGHWSTTLSRDHTLVRYDQRGTGLSDWEVPSISFEAWVRDLETVVDALGLERFPLLGISQGASIAIAYAVRHPERVSHLILHGGYARGRLQARRRRRSSARRPRRMVKLAEIGWGQDDAAFRQFFTTQFIPDGTPEQHHWFNELERVSTSPAQRGAHPARVQRDRRRRAAAAGALPDAGAARHRRPRVPFDEGRLIAGADPRRRASCRWTAATT